MGLIRVLRSEQNDRAQVAQEIETQQLVAVGYSSNFTLDFSQTSKRWYMSNFRTTDTDLLMR